MRTKREEPARLFGMSMYLLNASAGETAGIEVRKKITSAVLHY
jgi:hypothetical protein